MPLFVFCSFEEGFKLWAEANRCHGHMNYEHGNMIQKAHNTKKDSGATSNCPSS